MQDNQMHHVIAVDGPAAAGKTTTSLALAGKFGLDYLESGKAYRIVAFEALQRNLPAHDTPAIAKLCAELDADGGPGSVLASDRYTPEALRLKAVTALVPVVAGIPEVRRHITGLITQWAAERERCIVEGRDIGTAVFPAAQVKFYLTATDETRARRRVLQEPGQDYETVLRDLQGRDTVDSTRATAPLAAADDAVTIDTTDLTIEDVIQRMAAVCRAGDPRSTASPSRPQSQPQPDSAVLIR